VQRFRGGLVFKAHRLLYHSTLGLRVIKKRRRRLTETQRRNPHPFMALNRLLVFFFTLVTGPRRSSSLKLSDTGVYAPQIRATSLRAPTNSRAHAHSHCLCPRPPSLTPSLQRGKMLKGHLPRVIYLQEKALSFSRRGAKP